MEFKIDFTGKAAISTGAASGMGALFAKCFAEAGGDVLLCDVNREGLESRAGEINALGAGRAVPCYCDVRDYASVTAARDKAVEEFGRIDVLCNFAGGSATRIKNANDPSVYREFPDIPIEVFDWGLDVNLKGPFYFAHAVLARMREQKTGLIVNMGSITGAEGSARDMSYATAKAGLMHGLTKSIAQYGAPYGIRCVCVSPGPVLTRAAMAGMKTFMKRAAEPREIIDLILYIASERGQFIDGENIMIDGGRNCMRGVWYE